MGEVTLQDIRNKLTVLRDSLNGDPFSVHLLAQNLDDTVNMIDSFSASVLVQVNKAGQVMKEIDENLARFLER